MHRISVLTIYVDESYNQIGVKIHNEDTGEVQDLVVLSVFLRQQKNIIPVNFEVLDNKYIRVKGEVQFVELMSRLKIEKKYKEQMICLHPYMTTDGRLLSRITYGVLIWNGDGEPVHEAKRMYFGNEYAWISNYNRCPYKVISHWKVHRKERM